MNRNMKQNILKIFKNQPILASIATITENKKPWVRYVVISLDPKNLKIRFATCLDSRKVKQITAQPEIHLTCGINDPQQFPGAYLQIQGQAKIATTKSERKRAWNKELKKIFKSIDDPNYGIVIVDPYHIEFVSYDASGQHNSVWKHR